MRASSKFDLTRLDGGSPTHVLVPRRGRCPNNDLWPALHYSLALGDEGANASAYEERFAANGWLGAWRNGVFAFHHYHTTAHEVLGIYRGWARVVLGGDGGHEIALYAGDVVVIPAGVAHCKRDGSADFAVVGAYADGLAADTCTPESADVERSLQVVKRVPKPKQDPVNGQGGALTLLWA